MREGCDVGERVKCVRLVVAFGSNSSRRGSGPHQLEGVVLSSSEKRHDPPHLFATQPGEDQADKRIIHGTFLTHSPFLFSFSLTHRKDGKKWRSNGQLAKPTPASPSRRAARLSRPIQLPPAAPPSQAYASHASPRRQRRGGLQQQQQQRQ